ncbi:MAG: hypothetical protein K5882_11035 [Bacteroidales bacterium]|nr:hypothetical protein [Bacteroidales bacterium]
MRPAGVTLTSYAVAIPNCEKAMWCRANGGWITDFLSKGAISAAKCTTNQT